ncbi:hypothetical protein [Salinicoccus sp. HZC-1]|uniref:hypothetical protein n=1 Tax=Salinicoccus sp. HZC-1 TaxID=3385497 RepID=UPI00398ABBD6
MKYGYIVRIGHCFFRHGNTDAHITKELSRAVFFTKKKEAIETANRYGGRALEIQLTGIEGSDSDGSHQS